MTGEPWRWSEEPRLTPDEFMRLGALSVALPLAARRLDMSGSHDVNLDGLNANPREEDLLGEVLDELLEEEGALERWAQDGDPAIDAVLNAMTADPDDMHGQHLDDLSGSYGTDLDLTGASFGNAIDAGIELAEQREERDMAIKRLTHVIGVDAYQRHGDWHALAEAHLQAGPGSKAIALAQEYGGYGSDSGVIELARAAGTAPPICGSPDAFSRCASQVHDPSCSHVIEASASYGQTPQDADAWRSTLQRHAGLALADSNGSA